MFAPTIQGQKIMERYPKAKGMERHSGRHADCRGDASEAVGYAVRPDGTNGPVADASPVGGRVYPHVDGGISKDRESHSYAGIRDLTDWKLWPETRIPRCRTQGVRGIRFPTDGHGNVQAACIRGRNGGMEPAGTGAGLENVSSKIQGIWKRHCVYSESRQAPVW